MENPAPRSFDFSRAFLHRINAFPFLIPTQYGGRRGYRTDNARIIEPTWKSRPALHNGFILSNPHYSIATTRCIEDRTVWWLEEIQVGSPRSFKAQELQRRHRKVDSEPLECPSTN